MTSRNMPNIVLVYGLLGILPFLAPPALMLLGISSPILGSHFAAIYGALILSFLGGARWGFEVANPQPRLVIVSLAMLPTLLGLSALLLPAGLRTIQLVALAVLLLLHFAWDCRSSGLPAWYPRLRAILTTGATFGLLSEAALIA